jgi:cleavage and polyadenylation specificity factor subunit 1
VLLLQADESGDLDEIPLNDRIASKSWLSGCLYADHSGMFSPVETGSQGNIHLFLLSAECKLLVSGAPSVTVYSAM